MSQQQEIRTIQVYPVKDDSSYHVQNEPGEIERSNVVDDLCNGLLLQSHIVGVLHGTLSPNGDFGTLIVMSFHFQGQGQSRRFQEAEIKVRFADEKRPLDADPELLSMWPEGVFTFSESEDSVNETVNGEVNVGGQLIGLTMGVTGGWSRTTLTKQTDRASLNGCRRIEGREWGKKNVMRLTVQENATQKSGIPSYLSAAILLKRRNKHDRFVAHVEIEGRGGKRYQIGKALRAIMGATPKTDPIIFDPSALPSLVLANTTSDNLASANLENLSQVVSTTIISPAGGSTS